jgi:hypothetical protein
MKLSLRRASFFFPKFKMFFSLGSSKGLFSMTCPMKMAGTVRAEISILRQSPEQRRWTILSEKSQTSHLAIYHISYIWCSAYIYIDRLINTYIWLHMYIYNIQVYIYMFMVTHPPRPSCKHWNIFIC